MLGSFFEKFRKGLEKTRTGGFGRIQDVLKGKPWLDEETLEEIEEILIQADVGIDPSHRIIDRLRERYRKEDVVDMKDTVFSLLDEEIGAILTASQPLDLTPSPTVFLIVGVNGVGKTTTIGKLAAKFVATRKPIAEVLERWEHILFPLVLIVLGFVILIEGGAFGP